MDESGVIAPSHFRARDGASRPGVARRTTTELDPLLHAALDSMRGGLIVLTRDKMVRLVTKGATDMLGIRLGQGASAPSLLRLLAASPLLDHAALQMLSAAFDTAEEDGREVMLSLPDASGSRLVTLDVRPAGDRGWVVSMEDVTQTRQSRDWLLEHVSSDPVTGLWNRQHFMLMLRDRLEMGDARGATASVAVLMVCLKRFQTVCEALGTAASDALLRLVGGRLGGFLREDDMVARLAGHEFAIAMSSGPSVEQVASVTDRLTELLSRPYMVEGQLITLGAAVGVARSPDDGDSAESLVANAGLALHAAIAGYADGVRFFEPKLTDEARQRRALEADLRCALAGGEFELHYQPQVDMRLHRVTGLEALIRWRSTGRGLVSPADFIPLAEEVGLICAIGEWVLQAACHEAVGWPADISVAVNASPRQFETGTFARTVEAALEASGLPPHRLEIEITENLLLGDSGAVLRTLDALHAMGVKIALDDFGTGFASLSQLSRYRFDRIKIDRSFIGTPEPTLENHAIVRLIAALGISLGIPTTAEGVETSVQLDQIRADGCSSVQGYYFSRPVPASDVLTLVAQLDRTVPADILS